MLLHTKSEILETLTWVFWKTRATHVSRVRKNFANEQVARASPKLSVCVYVLTEISMDTLSQHACVRPTLLDVLCKRTQQCWTTLGQPRNKGNVGCVFWAVLVFTQPTPNNSQQILTTLNRVCKRAKHVHWTTLGACSVNMFSTFARGLMSFSLHKGMDLAKICIIAKGSIILWIFIYDSRVVPFLLHECANWSSSVKKKYLLCEWCLHNLSS